MFNRTSSHPFAAVVVFNLKYRSTLPALFEQATLISTSHQSPLGPIERTIITPRILNSKIKRALLVVHIKFLCQTEPIRLATIHILHRDYCGAPTSTGFDLRAVLIVADDSTERRVAVAALLESAREPESLAWTGTELRDAGGGNRDGDEFVGVFGGGGVGDLEGEGRSGTEVRGVGAGGAAGHDGCL